jgi:uncharacterized OB-fold protein
VSEPITKTTSPTRLDYVVRAGTVTGAFLRHVLERRLVGRRCPGCAKVYLPPRGACPTCGVEMTDEVEVAQQGNVTAFSIIRIPFEGQVLEPPYAAASILLDGADVPLLHIVGGCPVDDVRLGLRVEAVWADEPAPTLASLRYFRPVSSAPAPSSGTATPPSEVER